MSRHLLGKIHSSIAHAVQPIGPAPSDAFKPSRLLGAADSELSTLLLLEEAAASPGGPPVNGGSRGDSLTEVVCGMTGGGGGGDEMPKHGETAEILYVKQP